MPLPAYYVEVFHSSKVASGGLVDLYWQRCFMMFTREIIYNAERKLMKGHLRNINNTMELCAPDRDKCEAHLT